MWPFCINIKFHVDPHSLLMEPISRGKVNAAQLKEERRGQEERETRKEWGVGGEKEGEKEGEREGEENII